MVTRGKKSEAYLLFGKARRAILGLLLTHADESFYLREIERLCGIGIGPVQRDLSKLVKFGIIKRTRDGKQVYFQANEKSPIFEELKSIIIKTFGIADILKSALEPLANRIDIAFIYGSIAKGSEDFSSDIDLMIIGNVKLSEIVKTVSLAQKDLNREINPSVYSLIDFRKRIRTGNTFIKLVLKSEKIMLIGDVNELEELG